MKLTQFFFKFIGVWHKIGFDIYCYKNVLERVICPSFSPCKSSQSSNPGKICARLCLHPHRVTREIRERERKGERERERGRKREREKNLYRDNPV